MNATAEILINSSLVTHDGYRESYEFVLDDTLRVIECIKVDPTAANMIMPVINPTEELEGLLFELNHVRVNPRVDNSHIIDCLTKALNNVGVEVKNQQQPDMMAQSFRPLGEITANVRFYISAKTKMVFLSPALRPKLVSTKHQGGKDLQ